MIRARSIGLMVTDPQRGHVALHAMAPLLTVPEDLDGLGVGMCVDGAVLLSRKPSPDTETGLARLVGPLKGRCGVVRLRDASEMRPARTSSANLGPFRWRHFACTVVGGPQGADEAGESRDRLVNELPDFLRRSVAGQSESEAFFYSCLAELHEAGQLDRAPRGAAIVDAVRSVIARTADGPRHVAIATGLEVITVARGLAGAILFAEGLDESIAEELDPTLVDSSMGRERLRRFRAAMVAAAPSGTLEELPPAPDKVSVTRLVDDAAVVVGRDLEPQTL